MEFAIESEQFRRKLATSVPMHDFYRVPAVVLLSILLIVFLLLYLQNRTPRRLLWLMGWALTIVRLVTEMVLHNSRQGAIYALANTSMVLAAVMFLGSMSPLAFRRFPKILYVYVFAAPILVYSAIVSFLPEPPIPIRALLMLCMAASMIVALVWNLNHPLFSRWISLPLLFLAGGFGLWLTFKEEYIYVLYLAQSGSNFITALLILANYRRLNLGTIFTSVGFFLWSLPLVLDTFYGPTVGPMIAIGRGTNMVKVVAAIGMVLIVLEEELSQNKAAKERDHRARRELERYSMIDFSLFTDVHIEAAYQRVCDAISEASRFSQAMLLLPTVENNYTVAAHSGMEPALVAALEDMSKLLTFEIADSLRTSKSVVIELGATLQIDVRALPGMDCATKLLQPKAHIIRMLKRDGSCNGMLFLSGLKHPEDALRADDVLPLELLASRLGAARENTALMQRLARSEKLAGLGQLATGLAHELNNPLTVVLGYSELAEEELTGHPAQRDISMIRSEARRMRQTIESMLRFWRPARIEPVPVSLSEVLKNLHQLHGSEFDRRRVQLQLQVATDLPNIYANRTQLHQVLLRILQHSLEAFDGMPRIVRPTVRVDASRQMDTVRILITHNGRAFDEPDTVFDPFTISNPVKPVTGMGLSVCYAVIRDHGGEISAHNLQMGGAAVVIELPAEKPSASEVFDGNELAI